MNPPPSSAESTRTSFTSTGSQMTTGVARPPGVMPPPVGWPFQHSPGSSRLFPRGLPHGPMFGSAEAAMQSAALATTQAASVAQSLRTSPQHLLAPYIYPHLPHTSHPTFPYHSAYASLIHRPPFGLGPSDMLSGTRMRPPNYGLSRGTSPPGVSGLSAGGYHHMSERSLSESGDPITRRFRTPTTPSSYLPASFFGRPDLVRRLGPHHKGPPLLPPAMRHLPYPAHRLSLDKNKSRNEAMPYYPCHFRKGTIIQLGHDEFKCVEELCTDDFVKSASMSDDLKMDSSTVVRIEPKSSDTVILSFSVGEDKLQVSVEATIEHPFFVMGQGWSSCSPERTLVLYQLPCKRLQVGDVCMSLTRNTAKRDGSSVRHAEYDSSVRHAAYDSSMGRGSQTKEEAPLGQSTSQPPQPSPSEEPLPKKRRWSFSC